MGSREDLDDPLRRHSAGESNATKHGVPWRLLHTESFATRSEAAIKERYYKTGRGRDELDRFATCRRGDHSTKLSYTPNFC